VIVIIGSRHDALAAELLACWPAAALCSAEDLLSPGWVWRLGGADAARRWVVQGRVVDDDEVSGVFVRRSAVFAGELAGVHPDDRAYMAAEATAFVSALLARTRARRAQPLIDGAYGDEVLRAERLAQAARRAAVVLAPFTSRSAAPAEPRPPKRWVEVVNNEVLDGGSPRQRAIALRLVEALAWPWAAVAFDAHSRVQGLALTRPAAPATRAALGAWLGAPR